MLRYIVRRVLWGVALLLIVSVVVFIIFYVFPSGDPAKLRSPKATPEQLENIRESLHLDDPVYVQYFEYMKDLVLHQDFGRSYQTNTPVIDQIVDRLPVTGFLVAGAVVLWLGIALPVGVISAVKRRSLLDRMTMITTLSLVSAPVFWLGLVALYLFAQDIGTLVPIFPGQGSYLDADNFVDRVGSMLLPWFVLAAATAAIYARYLRASMIDTMSEDYIRTARAKGLPERQVIVRHGVRSAVTPVVTLLGIDVGLLLAGNAILTDSVFNIPGVGRLVVTAIDRADLPVIQGVVLFGALFIVVLNLLVDIAYAYLDPRVRY